jgi:hypothetical protein
MLIRVERGKAVKTASDAVTAAVGNPSRLIGGRHGLGAG